MKRAWKPFDHDILIAELSTIPQPDRGSLFEAMARYRDDLPGGFVVKNYGGGLMMLKATNRTSGRCLYFTENEANLILLLAYKKESNEAPASVMKTARRRMLQMKESN